MRNNQYLWTFGNHEPVSMYRRIGGGSTGGVTGSARWLEEWHHWYDSEECAETMESLGLNIQHCRFYKGMGWEYEKQDFPAVKSFVDHCHKHHIKVLGYVQFGSLYYEIMQREIPSLRDWAAIDYDGKPQRYLSSYWRWMPCTENAEWKRYMEKILTIMLEEGNFDGVMFDNLFGLQCYCPACQNAFREHIRACNFDFVDPDFVELPPPVNPAGGEIMDRIYQEMFRFRAKQRADALKHFYSFLKARRPDFLVSGNFMLTRRENYTTYCNDPLLLKDGLDLVVGQSGNEPAVPVPNGVISQIPELKMSKALNKPALSLSDSDGGGVNDVGARYICGLFENLFAGGIPVDRTIMKPKRGGALYDDVIERRRPILRAVREIGRDCDALLNAPSYEPIGLLYSNESIMFSQRANEAFLRAECSLLRGHLPFRRVIVNADGFLRDDWKTCETIILPGSCCLSDRVVAELLAFRGKLVTAGEFCGDYDESYCQRRENPFTGHAEPIALTPHEIVCEGWKQLTVYQPDDWSERFAAAVRIDAPPALYAEIKMQNAFVGGVLMTAPCPLGEIKIRIAPERAAKSYSLRTVNGVSDIAADSSGVFTLNSLDGMAMLLARRD